MHLVRYLAIAVCFMSLSCSSGILRIHDYKKFKKTIASVDCITYANLMKVHENWSLSPLLWERTSSPKADSFSLTRMRNFIQDYSTKKFVIIQDTVPIDSLTYSGLQNVFSRLNPLKTVDSFLIDKDIIAKFASRNSRYLLFICQDGYHYSRKYLDRIEGAEMINALGVLTLATVGVGVFNHGYRDKGCSSLAVLFIDTENSKVLYYAKDMVHNNPLADSTIIEQLSYLFMKF